MPHILIVLLLGTGINVANDHPHNFADVKSSILKQLQHPVISAADPEKYNK